MKNALLISFYHPYGATENITRQTEVALFLQGYKAKSLFTGYQNFETELIEALSSSIDLIFFIGALPFNISAGNLGYLWQLINPKTKLVFQILDQIPYDFKIAGCHDFFKAYHQLENAYIFSYEKNIADTLSEYTNKEVFYLPTPANFSPFEYVESVGDEKRIMFWGSIGAELHPVVNNGDLLETLKLNNFYNLDLTRLKDLAEYLLNSDESYFFKSLEKFLECKISDLIKDEKILELCNLDSAIKRYRRFTLIDSINDYPIDIYGKNWEKFINPNKSNVKICTAIPDDNSTFGYLCQKYYGVLNTDPNWGYGSNERAMTAFALGIPLLTNKNYFFKNDDNVVQYTYSKKSIHDSIDDFINKNLSHTERRYSCTYELYVTKILEIINLSV